MYGFTNKIIPTGSKSDVTMRLAGESDARDLVRLAALDSAPVPTGPTVVAEVDQELVAALPIDGRGAIADPFHRTAALVQMLELRAGQLRAPGASAVGAGSGAAALQESETAAPLSGRRRLGSAVRRGTAR